MSDENLDRVGGRDHHGRKEKRVGNSESGQWWQLTADFFAEFESRSTVTKTVDLTLHHHYIPLDPTNAAGRDKT